MPEPLLTIDDLAVILHVHPVTIRRKYRERGWPHVRSGRRVLFTRQQIDKILEAESQPGLPAQRKRRTA